jgi:hypothetical protein
LACIWHRERQPIIIDRNQSSSMQEAGVSTQEAPDAASDVLAGLEGKLFATVPEVAVVLRSDVRSVRRSIAAGTIPATPVGPRKLVPVQWLREAAGLETSGAGH